MTRIRLRSCALAAGFAAATLSLPAQAASCGAVLAENDRRGALADMRLASEAIPADPRGRPLSYDWIPRGRVNLGDDPGRYRQILPWAAAFGVRGNAVPNARMELRNMQMLVLSRSTGQWQPVVSTANVFGQHFDLRVETNRTHGNLSIARSGGATTVGLDARFMDHFWPRAGRMPIDPDDIGGIYASVEARMNPADFDAGAAFVLNVGVDYWLDAKADWDNFRTNGDAGVGRLKLLTPQWRTYYMTTATPAALSRCIAAAP